MLEEPEVSERKSERYHAEKAQPKILKVRVQKFPKDQGPKQFLSEKTQKQKIIGWNDHIQF